MMAITSRSDTLGLSAYPEGGLLDLSRERTDNRISYRVQAKTLGVIVTTAAKWRRRTATLRPPSVIGPPNPIMEVIAKKIWSEIDQRNDPRCESSLVQTNEAPRRDPDTDSQSAIC